MFQKREQIWWLVACVVGLLVAAWAAGGFIGPLLAVFIILFLAGAVLIEFDGSQTPGTGTVESSDAEPLRQNADAGHP